jgi:hypothetical protein
MCRTARKSSGVHCVTRQNQSSRRPRERQRSDNLISESFAGLLWSFRYSSWLRRRSSRSSKAGSFGTQTEFLQGQGVDLPRGSQPVGRLITLHCLNGDGVPFSGRLTRIIPRLSQRGLDFADSIWSRTGLSACPRLFLAAFFRGSFGRTFRWSGRSGGLRIPLYSRSSKNRTGSGTEYQRRSQHPQLQWSEFASLPVCDGRRIHGANANPPGRHPRESRSRSGRDHRGAAP